MKTKSSRTSALTLVEAIVFLFLIFILVVQCTPIFWHRGALVKAQMTQTLSNQRQLLLATQAMELDGLTNRDPNLGWPGDTGGTFTNWATHLVPAYLSTNDFCKLLSAPGKIVKPEKFPPALADSALLVYAVSTNSPTNAVFLTSANFTNTPGVSPPLNPAAKPYGDKGFVIFRKSGDGAILLPKQVGQTNLIGSFVPLLR